MKTPMALLDSLFGRGKRVSWVVLGLGNPGERYEGTRHNVGQLCVDRVARQNSISISRRRSLASVGEGEFRGHAVALAKSRTFVNVSGRAATSLLARYRASPAELLVILDDMDLPAGRMRLRSGGGSGGHNGLKSIIQALGTQEFARLRIGIGRPGPGNDEVQHVLGPMSAEDRGLVDSAIDRAVEAVVCLVTEGIDEAMNRFN